MFLFSCVNFRSVRPKEQEQKEDAEEQQDSIYQIGVNLYKDWATIRVIIVHWKKNKKPNNPLTFDWLAFYIQWIYTFLTRSKN